MNKAKDDMIRHSIKSNWERINSILIPAARHLGNRNECTTLPTLTTQERRQHVLVCWGPTALSKVEAFLDRIGVLEAELAADNQPAQNNMPSDAQEIPSEPLPGPDALEDIDSMLGN